MARIRVFLCTYRRPTLLRRALRSLMTQTLTDWICELHNDAPDDDSPLEVLREIAHDDGRFIYHAHDRNWGPVATFNHAFAGGPEPFASLLEDDNWWEPDFLATAVSTLEVNPTASLVWSNMKLWQEQSDRTWIDTARTVWSFASPPPPTVEFCTPESYQAFDALHSQGAMLFRPRAFRVTNVPSFLPLAIIELARERAATGPLLLLTAPLAHFACTLSTARDSDPSRWLQAKLLVAASFFQHVSLSSEALTKMWAVRRAQRPRDTGIFFCLALTLRDARFLHDARLGDWIQFLLSTARHPIVLARGLGFRRAHPVSWNWFLAQSRAIGSGTARSTVLSKQPLT